MKRNVTYLFILALIVSCQDSGNITFEALTLANTKCEECPEVTIEVPNALGNNKLAKSINRALQEEVISKLTFDDEINAETIQEAIESFTNGYFELKKIYPDETIGWQAKINGMVTYEDNELLTIELQSYLFTGGAHGYGSTNFLNFSKKRGKEMDDWELFKDKEGFEQYAETQFRLQHNIPVNKPINSTGFMFEKDHFYLPENIGFTEKGIKLLYNQYEVASYADGPIELTLPYKDIRKFLSGNIKT
ncbi:DUF3298 and DUF4163 domain-containing protein [uncultured Eudoraea sp.]|jgi:hypothetical protein|uniref:DUF3298 and DUF4163 domain-containing protein n=1 Tax=uncultured Eudoraea sp. TaxID=1035614 RepID=UPI00261950C5|nr:DUF3298 and DUF4163 domain-containing protein [uncultured Eudoraea sp.]